MPEPTYNENDIDALTAARRWATAHGHPQPDDRMLRAYGDVLLRRAIRLPLAAVDESCAFCAIVAGDAPATVIRRWRDALAIVPLNPVTPGHLLVIPTEHVPDALAYPDVTAATMRAAAELAVGPCNLITSVGREATQSVFHLHVHIVPRAAGDGLALPWYSGRLKRSNRSE